jgi:hypothetical protein
MGLFNSGNTPQGATDNSINALQQGYGAASSQMSPYTNPASQDFNTARGLVYGGGSKAMKFGNPYDQWYGYAKQNPENLFNGVVSSYSMSPAEQEAEQQALNTQNNMAAANGMYGSGENDALDSEISTQAYNSGLQSYLKGIGKTVGYQQQFLSDWSNQVKGLSSMFSKLINKEYGASDSMADIDKSLSQTAANEYARQPNDKNRRGAAIGSIIGGGLSTALLMV